MDSFTDPYAAMPDDDLQRLSLDVKSLLPEAREALRGEMERRQLAAVDVEWTPQPVIVPAAPQKFSGTFYRFARNFFIFLGCDVVYIAIIAVLLSKVQGIDMEALGSSLSRMFLSISLLLAIVTTKFLVPKTLKAVWITGIVAPPGAFLLFWLLRLFR